MVPENGCGDVGYINWSLRAHIRKGYRGTCSLCSKTQKKVPTSMLQTIEPTLETLGINQNFAGVTIIALVPSSAEVSPSIFSFPFLSLSFLDSM